MFFFGPSSEVSPSSFSPFFLELLVDALELRLLRFDRLDVHGDILLDRNLLDVQVLGPLSAAGGVAFLLFHVEGGAAVVLGLER